MLKLNQIDQKNLRLLDLFLDNAGSSLKTFRYFQKRPKEAIVNHIVTYIITENDIPVCYGHLDKEDDNIWLGVAVAETYQGKGFGSKMMTYLIDFARKNRIEKVFLSVDNDNMAAIKLYLKFGFTLKQKNEKNSFYVLKVVT